MLSSQYDNFEPILPLASVSAFLLSFDDDNTTEHFKFDDFQEIIKDIVTAFYDDKQCKTEINLKTIEVISFYFSTLFFAYNLDEKGLSFLKKEIAYIESKILHLFSTEASIVFLITVFNSFARLFGTFEVSKKFALPEHLIKNEENIEAYDKLLKNQVTQKPMLN